MKNEIAKKRQHRGWSQAELGMMIGVSRQTIISIEKGKYDPSLPLAFKLARVFECRIEDLFDDELASARQDPSPQQKGI
mgnify:FL=1